MRKGFYRDCTGAISCLAGLLLMLLNLAWIALVIGVVAWIVKAIFF